MRVLFFTDPHIGLRRSSHTTVASQEKMRDFLYDEVMKMLDEQSEDSDKVVCLGDLFDLYSNKEDVIAQGAAVTSRCDFILAGNHDLRNSQESTSSLQLLQKMEMNVDPNLRDYQSRFIISPDGGTPYFRNVDLEDDVHLMFVPHCFSQAVFEESIDLAISAKNDGFNILCLHCNVGEGFGHAEAAGTSLYLTDAMQAKINKAFDLCLVGHEHEPKKTKKIVTLGNFFPVSFGEIANRYVYHFDTEEKKLDKTLTFGEPDQYSKFDVFDFLSAGGEIAASTPLVEIIGEIEQKTYPDLSRALLKFWKENGDVLFAVKNSVTVEKPNDVGRQKDSAGVKMSLVDIVKGSAKKAGYDAELNALTQELGERND